MPHRHYQTVLYRDGVEVSISAEVPISDDNYRVVMRGNRYYPTMIDIDLDTDHLGCLNPEDAREIAAMLLEAAQVCDDIDGPCTDPCHHWHPCDCATNPHPSEIPF